VYHRFVHVSNQDLDFQMSCQVFCNFNDLWREVIVYFVDIDGIVDHRCLIFLFINILIMFMAQEPEQKAITIYYIIVLFNMHF